MRKQPLSIDIHAADLDRAVRGAEELGLPLDEYLVLCAHVVSTAVLMGRSSFDVPYGVARVI
jgi:hypothetical protein